MYINLHIFINHSECTDTNAQQFATHITHNHHTHTHPPTHTYTHTRAHTTMCLQDGFFPLYVASQGKHDRVVEMLLQAGATVDLQNKVENCVLLSLMVYHVLYSLYTKYHQHSGEYI